MPEVVTMLVKRIIALTREALSFDSGDYIAVDSEAAGSRKMSKDTLLKETAQNALGSIHSLNQSATEADLVAGNYLAIDGSAGTKKLPVEIVGNIDKYGKLSGTSVSVYSLGEVNGYLGTDGSLNAQSAERLEKTSDFIRIFGIDPFYIRLKMSDGVSRSFWIAIAEYDSDKNFIARYSVTTSTLVEYAGLYTPTNSTAAYVRVSYRSYGVSQIEMYSSVANKVLDLYANKASEKDLNDVQKSCL